MLLVLLASSGAAPAQPEGAGDDGQRVALVIGNGAYAGAALRNSTRDAQDVAAALRALGFDVTLLKDATRAQMEQAMRELYLRGRTAAARLFYFAGHGVQAGGSNYLLPSDVRLGDGIELRRDAVDVTAAIAVFAELPQGANIFILYACRESPLPSFGRRRGTPGLAMAAAPRGTLIAFATHPGGTAQDSPELPNSLYTGHLLRHVDSAGITIEQVFKNTRADVVRVSAGRQVPWETSSLIGDFCLRRGAGGRCGR
jgi:uncharacterized caspase-like protein